MRLDAKVLASIAVAVAIAVVAVAVVVGRLLPLRMWL